jgi:hypothetical protein
MTRLGKKIKATLSRRKASKRERATSAARSMNWPAIQRWLNAVAWVLAAGGIGAGWVYGVPRFEENIARAHAALGSQAPLTVNFIHAPQWVTTNASLHGRLVQTAAAPITADPLAHDDLVASRESLLASGWFEDVAQVRRAAPDLLEIHASFARPYALVRDHEGDHLVDHTGRLLPLKFPVGSNARSKVILGTRYARPERLREPWEGADLAAALAVLQLIESKPWLDQVAAVDVSDFLDHDRIKLLTTRGSTIIWGRAPGDERVGEVPAAQKLAYLDYHVRETGQIDRGHKEVEIVGDIVIGR